MEGSHIWVPWLLSLAWGGQAWLRREHTLSEKDPIMGKSSGAQFTKPEPDAPEAHLGKDANPNMSTLTRTGVGTLAKVNTIRHISESLRVQSPHPPFSSPIVTTVSTPVRKHLTRGFLCAVLDMSGTLWPLLIPEYSGIKRRGTPFTGLRNPGISHYGDKYPLPFYESYGKR